MIAGSRACSTSTRLTHSTITNQTSPHFAEALKTKVMQTVAGDLQADIDRELAEAKASQS
jgi:hypothetical protein